jgi:hypothetical protein
MAEPQDLGRSLDEIEQKLTGAAPAVEKLGDAALSVAAEIAAALGAAGGAGAPGMTPPGAGAAADPELEKVRGANPGMDWFRGPGGDIQFAPLGQGPQGGGAAGAGGAGGLPPPPPLAPMLPPVPAEAFEPPQAAAAPPTATTPLPVKITASEPGALAAGMPALPAVPVAAGVPPGGPAGAPAPAGPGMLGSFGEALGGLTGAVSGAVLPFTLVAGAVTGVIQAFDPSLVEMFSRSLKDLAAVAGLALAPVLQGLTTIAKDVGALMLPVARALAPVFQSLAQTVIQILTPGLDNFAAIVQELVPVVQFVADVLANLGTVVRVSGAFVAGWINQFREWFGALFGGTGDAVKSFQDGLRDAIQNIARAALLLVGYLARVLGMTGFLDGMIKSLGRKPGKGGIAEGESAEGLAAPQQARVTNIGDVQKSQLASAFMATGGLEAPKDTNAWLEQVVKELNEIKAGRTNAVDDLVSKIEAVLDGLEEDFKNYLDRKWNDLLGSMGKGALETADHSVGFIDVGGEWHGLGKRLKDLFGG